MIVTQNAIEGFTAVIGGYVQSLVCAIVMAFCIRAPDDYKTQERNEAAKTLFWVLLSSHVIMTVYRFLYLNLFSWMRNAIVIFMFMKIILITYLSQSWLYAEDVEDITKTDDQFYFYRWLWVEYTLVFVNIVGVMIFMLLSSCSKPKVEIQTIPQYRQNKPEDFIYMYTILIQLFQLLIAPSLVNVWLRFVVYDNINRFEKERDWSLQVAAIFSYVQIACFWVGFMFTRSSESRKRFYNKIMPEVTHYCILFAGLIIPIILIILTTINLISTGVDDIVVFTLCSQIGLLLWFYLVFWAAADMTREFAKDQQKAVQLIQYRAEKRRILKTYYQADQVGGENDNDYHTAAEPGCCRKFCNLFRFESSLVDNLDDLRKPLDDETEEQIKLGEDFFKRTVKPYRDIERTRSDGLRHNLDQSL